MKVIFMGTPEFSVGTLEHLLAAGHEVVLAVTQPDKAKGRGKQMQFTPVKECAIKHDIPVYQPVKIRERECIDYLSTFGADIMVVVAFGQILPKEILDMPPYGCVNVHASLLPKYRGAAPIQWAIIDGEEVTGVTTMQMDVGLDTGDMIDKVELLIGPDETGGSLHDKLALEGAKLCIQSLEKIQDGSAIRTPQGESETSYAQMLTKELGNINWEKSATQIEAIIRGLNPWPSAYTHWNEKIMKIWQADVLAGAETMSVYVEADLGKIIPGTVVSCGKHSFFVETGDGLLEIKELQMPGKKRMDAGAFLRGNGVAVGDILKPL